MLRWASIFYQNRLLYEVQCKGFVRELARLATFLFTVNLKDVDEIILRFTDHNSMESGYL